MKHLLSSFRFYRRKSGITLVNLAGLSLGIAVFLILQLYIDLQKSYDRFFTDYESVYRVETKWSEEGEEVRYATAPPPLAPYLRDYTEVVGVTRLLNWSHFTLRPYNDSTKVFRETNVYIGDGQFFRVFPDRLVAGKRSALDEPGKIVLSESALRKYFGNCSPDTMIGRLVLGGKDAGTLWEITGVMKDFPQNSHMQFDLMVSMWDEFSGNELWTWNVMHTYVRTAAAPEEVENILDRAVDDHVIPFLMKQGAVTGPQEADSYAFTLRPIDEVHLQTGLRDAMEPGVREDYLAILAMVSILVIALACFNFMNVSTALAHERVTGVAIMKIHGASEWWLAGRFFLEYFLQVLVAIGLAAGLMELILLFLNDMYSLNLSVTGLLAPPMVGMLVILAVGCTLASGLYPAWYLLDNRAGSMLSGLKRAGKPYLRNSLIVVQFAISLFLIACTLTFDRQLDFLQQMDPGFDRHQILVIQNDREIEERRQDFIQALERLPEVVSASFTTGLPAMARYQLRDVKVAGSDVQLPITWYETDEHYPETLKIEISEGKVFTPDQPGQALLNEKAVSHLGLEEPVGARLVINEGAEDEHVVTVIGVMGDFHQQDFRSETEPLIIEYLDNFIFRDFIAIRYNSQLLSHTVEQVENTWRIYEPEVPMQHFFLDSQYNELFQSETMLRHLFAMFSILAICIALIGLMGVAAITARQRLREIGIRKVLGASSSTIVRLMVAQFSRLLLLSILIALPLSWISSNAWLNDFSRRVELAPMGFALIAGGVFLIACTLVTIQAWNASRVNPVDIIRKDS